MATIYTTEATGYYSGSTWKQLSNYYPDRFAFTYTTAYNSSTNKYDITWSLKVDASEGNKNYYVRLYDYSISLDGTVLSSYNKGS